MKVRYHIGKSMRTSDGLVWEMLSRAMIEDRL